MPASAASVLLALVLLSAAPVVLLLRPHVLLRLALLNLGKKPASAASVQRGLLLGAALVAVLQGLLLSAALVALLLLPNLLLA